MRAKFEVMRSAYYYYLCFGGALEHGQRVYASAHALGPFCGFFPEDLPDREWWHGPLLPLLFVFWCVLLAYGCARSCAYLCAGKKQWKDGVDVIPPKMSFIRACRGGSYANNLLKSVFFLFTIVLPLSLISVVRFIYICLLFTVVCVRSPFSCFCVGVCLPLIYLSFYSQNSS